MNKARIQAWVDALRSGEYEQTREFLGFTGGDDVTRYCCLGVACEVAIKDGLNLDREIRSSAIAYNDEEGLLPRAVVDWYGLDNVSPQVEIETGVYELTNLNDHEEFDFNAIADAIEANYIRGDA